MERVNGEIVTRKRGQDAPGPIFPNRPGVLVKLETRRQRNSVEIRDAQGILVAFAEETKELNETNEFEILPNNSGYRRILSKLKYSKTNTNSGPNATKLVETSVSSECEPYNPNSGDTSVNSFSDKTETIIIPNAPLEIIELWAVNFGFMSRWWFNEWTVDFLVRKKDLTTLNLSDSSDLVGGSGGNSGYQYFSFPPIGPNYYAGTPLDFVLGYDEVFHCEEFVDSHPSPIGYSVEEWTDYYIHAI